MSNQGSLENRRTYVAPEHGVELCNGSLGPGGIGADTIYREEVECLAERPIDDGGQPFIAKYDDSAPFHRHPSCSGRGIGAYTYYQYIAPHRQSTYDELSSSGNEGLSKVFLASKPNRANYFRIVRGATVLAEAFGKHDTAVVNDDIMEAVGGISIDMNGIVCNKTERTAGSCMQASEQKGVTVHHDPVDVVLVGKDRGSGRRSKNRNFSSTTPRPFGSTAIRLLRREFVHWIRSRRGSYAI